MIRVWIALASSSAGIVLVAGRHGVTVRVVRVLEFVESHGGLSGPKMLTLRDRGAAHHLVIGVQEMQLSVPGLQIGGLLEE